MIRNQSPMIPHLAILLSGCALLTMPFVFMAEVTVGSRGASCRFTLAELLFLAPLPFAFRGFRRLRPTPFLLLSAVLPATYLLAALAHPSASSLKEASQFLLTLLPGFIVLRSALAAGTFQAQTPMGILSLAGLLSGLIAGAQMLAGEPGFFVRAGLPDNQVYTLFQLIALPFLLSAIFRLEFGKRWLAGLLAGMAAACVSLTMRDTGLLLAFVGQTLVLFLILLPKPRRVFAILPAVMILMLHAGVHHDALLRFLSPYEYQDVSQAYFHGVGLANSGWGKAIALNAGKRQFKIESALIPGKREIPDSPPLAFDHGTLKQRYAEWHAAASMMNQHPVLGVGPGGYQQTIGEYYSPMPKLNTAEPGTQNGWLVLGSSIGVIGMLALMAALLWGAASLLPWFKVASPTGPASDARQLAPGIACLGLLLGGFWTPLFQTGTLVPIAVLLALTDSCLNPQWPSGDRIPLGLKKCLHGLSLLLPLAALGFTLAAVGSRPKTSDSVYLWQAAKQAQEIRQPMALKADPDASGGAALVLPKGVGKGWRNEAGGQAVFSFNLKESDRYNFWARTLWTDGCCNSLYTSFNDGRRLILGEDAEFGKWHWVRLTGLRLSQGRLRVTVSNREDGIAIDKFLLTNDETFQPQGQWEQVFTRDLSQPALTGWTPLGAAPWVIHKDKEMAGRYLPPGAGSAQALVLLDSALDSDFELECRFVLTDAAGGLRIPFLYQDPKNYHYLDLARTRASLGRLHDGRAEILEQTTGTQLIELNHPVRASLRLRSGAITVQCDGRNLMERIDRRQVAGRCGFGAPQGGVIVSSFDLRPLEGIYFLEDFTATSNGSAQRGGGMTIGRPDWGNYAVTLTAQGALTQPVVRLNVNESEQSWLEVALGQTECKISSVRKGGVAAAYSAARPKPAGAPAQASSSTLCIRSIDHDLTVLVDGHEIGRWALPAESSAKGAVQIANADGITRLEVKGLRRFYDGFGGCDGNNSASWPPHGGKWKVLTDPVAGLEDCFAQLGGGKAMALTGESYWEQYELGCMVRSAGENGIGLVLHYIDDANYDLIRWAAASSSLPYAGKLQWVRRREGRESVAGSADLSYDGDRWYEMRVSPSLGRDRLFIDGREVLAVPARDGERGAIGLFSEENPGTFFDNVRVDFF